MCVTAGARKSCPGTNDRNARTSGERKCRAAQPTPPDSTADLEATPESTDESPSASSSTLRDRFRATFSPKEDPDGPINTDRPTFTPANTVVPVGRLQVESGFTFNLEQTKTTRSDIYHLPELAVRYGLADRVELRTFWLGPTFDQVQSLTRLHGRAVGGASDMEVGFKWQLFAGDKERKWLPTTALITSIIAPIGGSSPLSNQTVEPYITSCTVGA